jgi:Flp pilus assembly protein TadD
VSLTIDLSSRRLLLADAIAALESRRFAAAEAACDLILAMDPADVDALLLRGLALAASGQAEPAARLLNRVAAARAAFAHPCRDLAWCRGTRGCA